MSASPRRLDDRISVSGQILPTDLSDLRATGVSLVINNRPEREEAGQPTGAEIEAAARYAGLRYLAIPIQGMPDAQAVAATAAALHDLAPGEGALLYCRSGMRSAMVWALAERSRGAVAEDLRAAAAAAGYDLSRIAL